MKTIAASVFLAGLAIAGPILDKRLLVTQEVVETVWTTTTIWVDPTAGARAQFHEVPVVESSSVLDPNLKLNFPTPSSTPPAEKKPEPTTPPAAAATDPIVPPAATTTAAALVAATTTKAADPPAQTAKVDTPPATGGSGSKSGDFTFYDPYVGTTSCGENVKPGDIAIAALGMGAMANGANPNANPNCNRWINIWANGVGPKRARVVDSCAGCANPNDVDVTESFFSQFASTSVGRLKMGAPNGMTWEWA